MTFVPIQKAKPGTLKEVEVTCNCGCGIKFKKKITGNFSTQTRHYLNKDHYRDFAAEQRHKNFIPFKSNSEEAKIIKENSRANLSNLKREEAQNRI